jgi:hypothetical protein
VGMAGCSLARPRRLTGTLPASARRASGTKLEASRGQNPDRRRHRDHPDDLAPGLLRLRHLLARCGWAGDRIGAKSETRGQRGYAPDGHRPSLCAGRAPEVRPDQPPEVTPDAALDATLDHPPDPLSVTARTRGAARDRTRDCSPDHSTGAGAGVPPVSGLLLSARPDAEWLRPNDADRRTAK